MVNALSPQSLINMHTISQFDQYNNTDVNADAFARFPINFRRTRSVDLYIMLHNYYLTLNTIVHCEATMLMP